MAYRQKKKFDWEAFDRKARAAKYRRRYLNWGEFPPGESPQGREASKPDIGPGSEVGRPVRQ